MTMDNDNGTNLPPQGLRRSRGSACGGGTVPAPPTSRGHCDPKSSDGLPVFSPVRRTGEKAFAELFRWVVGLLDVFVRHMEDDDDREGCHCSWRRSPCSAGPMTTSSEATPVFEAGDLMGINRSIEGLLTRVSRLEEWRDSTHRSPEAVPRRDNSGIERATVRSYAAAASPAASGGSTTPEGPNKEVHRQKAVSGGTVRCHNCRARGHIWRECPVPVDMRARCYWCGVEGHRAAACVARPFCWACHARGRRGTRHAAGGRGCPEYPAAGGGVSATTDEGSSPPPLPRNGRGREKKRGGTMLSPPSQEGEKEREVVPSGTSLDEAVGGVNPRKRREKKRRGNPDKESQGAHSSPRETGGGPKDSPAKEELSVAREEEDSRRRGNPDIRSQGAHTSPPGAGGGPGDSSVKEEDVLGKEDVSTPGEPGTLTSPQEAGGGPGDPGGVREGKEETIATVLEDRATSVPSPGTSEVTEDEVPLWGKADASIRCKECRVRGHGTDDCGPRDDRKCWRCGQSIRKTGMWHRGYRETRRCGVPDPWCRPCSERQRECGHVPGDGDLCLPRGPWLGPPLPKKYYYSSSSGEEHEEEEEEEDISEDDESTFEDTEEDSLEPKEDVHTPGDRGTLTSPREAGGGPRDHTGDKARGTATMNKEPEERKKCEDIRRERRENMRRAKEIFQLWITDDEVGKGAQMKGEISSKEMDEEYDEEDYMAEID